MMAFRFHLWCARRFGWWRYYGMMGMHPRGWPEARVYYPSVREVSRKMPIGNAVDQAARHTAEGAVVIPPNSNKAAMAAVRSQLLELVRQNKGNKK